MSNRNTLDPDPVSARARESGPIGHDIRSLGPSDSSDSRSDLVGAVPSGDSDEDAASDRNGTGAQLTIGEPEIRVANDIAPDRIVGAEEAGLGGGLDQAEEAQLGITDEELGAGSDDD